MTFIGVPWAVEGGALNQVYTARILAFAATQGSEGVVNLGHLKVSPLSTVGAGVQVSIGAAIIPCRAPGYDNQTYIASRPIADDTVPVPANGGASARYDLIVARVENPWLASESWPAPPNVADGPYVKLVRIDNVGAAAILNEAAARRYLRDRNMSAIPLAGLSMPAGANSVLAEYITDLRQVANPRTKTGTLVTTPSGRQNIPGSWGPWISPTGWLNVYVPPWATVLAFHLTIYGAKLDKQSSSTDGHSNGQIRLAFGDNPVYSEASNYDHDAPNNSGATRATIGCAAELAVPAEWRDTSQSFAVQGDQLAGNQPLYVDASSSVVLQYEFRESAV